MTTDFLETRKMTKKHTTMFEINDKNREFETRADDNIYGSKFISFLESLDFEIESKLHTNEIKIKDAVFTINFDNASYAGANAYTRKTTIRKNRFIAMRTMTVDVTKNYVIRININKEIDADKLKALIDLGVKHYHAREQHITTIQQERIDNTNKVGRHYLSNPVLKKSVNYILIHNGEISFWLKNNCGIHIFTNGKINNIHFPDANLKNLEEVQEFASQVSDRASVLESMVAVILEMPTISDDLAAWAKQQYNGYFYSKTMSAEKMAQQNRL